MRGTFVSTDQLKLWRAIPEKDERRVVQNIWDFAKNPIIQSALEERRDIYKLKPSRINDMKRENTHLANQTMLQKKRRKKVYSESNSHLPSWMDFKGMFCLKADIDWKATKITKWWMPHRTGNEKHIRRLFLFVRLEGQLLFLYLTQSIECYDELIRMAWCSNEQLKKKKRRTTTLSLPNTKYCILWWTDENGMELK